MCTGALEREEKHLGEIMAQVPLIDIGPFLHGGPWMPNTFAVNIGDLMAEWTNDRWVSTLHRVGNPPRRQASVRKTSLLFFHQPNYDAAIECIPTCTSADNPPRYGRTTSGEHVTSAVETA